MQTPAFDRINVRGVIKKDNKVFVVKHKEERDYYALVGGGVDKGENLFQALEREFLEETSIIPSIGNILFVHQFFSKNHQINVLEFFFEIKNTKDFEHIDRERASHAHEIFEYKRIDLDGPDKILPDFLKIELRQEIGYTRYFYE